MKRLISFIVSASFMFMVTSQGYLLALRPPSEEEISGKINRRDLMKKSVVAAGGMFTGLGAVLVKIAKAQTEKDPVELLQDELKRVAEKTGTSIPDKFPYGECRETIKFSEDYPEDIVSSLYNHIITDVAGGQASFKSLFSEITERPILSPDETLKRIKKKIPKSINLLDFWVFVSCAYQPNLDSEIVELDTNDDGKPDRFILLLQSKEKGGKVAIVHKNEVNSEEIMAWQYGTNAAYFDNNGSKDIPIDIETGFAVLPPGSQVLKDEKYRYRWYQLIGKTANQMRGIIPVTEITPQATEITQPQISTETESAVILNAITKIIGVGGMLLGIFIFYKIFKSMYAQQQQDPLIPLLKKLGYPEEKLPVLISEFRRLFRDKDINSFKSKLTSDPEHLKTNLSQLCSLLKTKGYLNLEEPHPLIKQLVAALTKEDTFGRIDRAEISAEDKKKLKYALHHKVVAQLTYILLTLMKIKIEACDTPQQSLNLIYTDKSRVLFVDFAKEIIKEINLSEQEEIPPIDEIFDVQIINDHGFTPSLYANLILVYTTLNLYNKAIGLAEKGQKLQPDYANIYLNHGYTHFILKEYYKATQLFRKALILNPNLALAYLNIGNIGLELGMKKEEVKEYYAMAISIRPELIDNIPEEFIDSVLPSGEDKSIIEKQEELIKSIKIIFDLPFYLKLANDYYNSHQYYEALSYYRVALKLNPKLAEAYLGIGNICLQTGKQWEAIKYFAKAINIEFELSTNIPKDLKKYVYFYALYLRLWGNGREENFEKRLKTLAKKITKNHKSVGQSI